MSTEPILAAARRLARALLKNTPHCPEIEFIGVRATKTGCATIATEAGFDIRIDRVRGSTQPLSAEVLIARTYHAAAHMLCIQAGVSSHSGSGRHTQHFEQALEELGAPEIIQLEDFSKSIQLAAVDFEKKLKTLVRTRPTKAKTAYERATITCPAEGCRHTITLRASAIAKTRFLCVKHGEEMSVPDA